MVNGPWVFKDMDFLLMKIRDEVKGFFIINIEHHCFIKEVLSPFLSYSSNHKIFIFQWSMSIFEISISYIGSFNHYHEKPHVEVPG